MKNSALIKGTAAIAVGAALLLGGGGTLASWNAEATGTPGTVVAGDLNVVKSGAGVWTDGSGDPVTISSYKVVPGDTLTYTQVLEVTLTGDKMAANITATGTGAVNGFDPDNVVVSSPALTVDGEPVDNPLTDSATVTATITFEFKSGTADRDDVTKSYNFGSVAFTLNQITQAGLS